MRVVLSRFRRHTKECPHRDKGRDYDRCSCPVHCQGKVAGIPVRESLNTRDWALAGRMMVELEQAIATGRVLLPFSDALDKFLDSTAIASSTRMKYARWAGYLRAFAKAEGLVSCDQWTLGYLDDYRKQRVRTVSELSWQKELQFLRQLFGWFTERKYMAENIAKAMKMPRDPQPAIDHEPFTKDEIASVLWACDNFGRGPYERRRAKALVLLGRKYGLRISDACLLSRDKIRDGQIMIRARKNDVVIWAPLYPEVEQALDALPAPRRGPASNLYYFWAGEGQSTAESFVKVCERTMSTLFRLAMVHNGHFHRFRHTLATELLVKGATIEDVANILGDDPDTVRKHYAKWSPEYQRRTAELLNRVHGHTAEPEKREVRVEYTDQSAAGKLPVIKQ
jgi:integrase